MKFIRKKLTKLHNFLKNKDKEITRLEKDNLAPKAGTKGPLRDKLAAAAGLVIIFLAITGIVFSSLFFNHVATHRKEQEYQEKLTYYTDFISPVVLFDTGEFTSPATADNLSLLIPSFFKAQEMVYADIEEREAVTQTDVRSRYIIRDEDVQKAAQHLFGQTVICHSFSLDGLLFEYVENEKYFLSPTTLWLAMYTPNITNIEETETGVALTVEYAQVAALDYYTVGKTMKITLTGEYKQEIITGITAAQS